MKAQKSSEEVPVDMGVDEDEVEKKDCQEEVEQDFLLFGETLLKHLERRITRPVATMRQMRQLPHLKFPKKICLR